MAYQDSKIFFIILCIISSSGCFLFERSTNTLPKLTIQYSSLNLKQNSTDIRKKEIVLVYSVNIEEEAKKKHFIISFPKFICTLHKDDLSENEGVVALPKFWKKENGKYYYKSSIWVHLKNSSKIDGYINEIKKSKMLYCQAELYFYLAKPTIQSNIFEVPSKDVLTALEDI